MEHKKIVDDIVRTVQDKVNPRPKMRTANELLTDELVMPEYLTIYYKKELLALVEATITETLKCKDLFAGY